MLETGRPSENPRQRGRESGSPHREPWMEARRPSSERARAGGKLRHQPAEPARRGEDARVPGDPTGETGPRPHRGTDESRSADRGLEEPTVPLPMAVPSHLELGNPADELATGVRAARSASTLGLTIAQARRRLSEALSGSRPRRTIEEHRQ